MKKNYLIFSIFMVLLFISCSKQNNNVKTSQEKEATTQNVEATNEIKQAEPKEQEESLLRYTTDTVTGYVLEEVIRVPQYEHIKDDERLLDEFTFDPIKRETLNYIVKETDDSNYNYEIYTGEQLLFTLNGIHDKIDFIDASPNTDITSFRFMKTKEKPNKYERSDDFLCVIYPSKGIAKVLKLETFVYCLSDDGTILLNQLANCPIASFSIYDIENLVTTKISIIKECEKEILLSPRSIIYNSEDKGFYIDLYYFESTDFINLFLPVAADKSYTILDYYFYVDY